MGLKEGDVPPRSLHLSQGLRKITPRRVSWGPQLNVFQPTISKKTDWRHKYHIQKLLRCPTHHTKSVLLKTTDPLSHESH